LISTAMSVDSKWKAEDHRADKIAFKRHVDYIDLKTHVGFSKENPVPKTREHQYSWQLAHVDPNNDGLPVTEDAASRVRTILVVSLKMSSCIITHYFVYLQRFGLGEVVPQDHFDELANYKTETIINHRAWQADQDRIKQEEKFAKHVHCDELKQYVDQRIKQLNRSYQRFQLTIECMEENRIAKREAERTQRRDRRIAGYEASERELMSIEDDHSHQRRFYEWETANQRRERKQMSAEHKLQCSFGDTFWGIDLERQRQLEMEARLRALWDAKVTELRDTCIRVRVTRPFPEEVRRKVFRDKITNKVIK
jgi:hypothetical protein